MSLSAHEMVELHAREHPLVFTDRFESAEQHCLFLVHMRAYEEARLRCTGLRVLDLGCNNGYGTNLLAREARSIVGCDVSTAALADARRRYPGIDFRETSGISLPFRDEEFDLVASFQVIEHIVDAAGYLKEIRRVLRPGGRAMLTTPNAAIRLDPGMRPWNRFHVREYRCEELRRLIGTVFETAEISGLFGADELYRLAYQRCQAALKRHRESRRRGLGRVRRRVTSAIKRQPWMRWAGDLPNRSRLQTGAQARSSDGSTLSRFSTDDLYYRNDDLDRALNLMAICERR